VDLVSDKSGPCDVWPSVNQQNEPRTHNHIYIYIYIYIKLPSKAQLVISVIHGELMCLHTQTVSCNALVVFR
jgi:hypothetical protein